MDGLIPDIQQGDIEAFKLVYDHFHEKLYFYIVKHSGSAYIAEEIVQTTFIKLWEKRSALSVQHTLSSQVFRIAKSLLLDHLRKAYREEKYKVVARHTLFNTEDGEGKIIAKEHLALIHETIEHLPPMRKKIFKLSRVDGLSYKEIAEKMSLSPKTVENHILLALKQLKAISLAIILLSCQR